MNGVVTRGGRGRDCAPVALDRALLGGPATSPAPDSRRAIWFVYYPRPFESSAASVAEHHQITRGCRPRDVQLSCAGRKLQRRAARRPCCHRTSKNCHPDGRSRGDLHKLASPQTDSKTRRRIHHRAAPMSCRPRSYLRRWTVGSPSKSARPDLLKAAWCSANAR